jgi:hypothetical protein
MEVGVQRGHLGLSDTSDGRSSSGRILRNNPSSRYLYVDSTGKSTYSLQSRSAVVAAALRAAGILGSSGRDIWVIWCGMFGCHCFDDVCVVVLGVLLKRRTRSDRIGGSCRWWVMGVVRGGGADGHL